MTPDPIAAGVARFLSAEAVTAGAGGPRPIRIAAVGTTAEQVVRSALLAEAVAHEGFTLAGATSRSDPDDLFTDESWGLAIVLSPWKRELGRYCDRLAPAARSTDVVDTVVRGAEDVCGYNTNTWAAQTALELLVAGQAPERLLVLGTGASARSVALAVARAWPGCRLVFGARSGPAAVELAERYGGQTLDGSAGAFDCVVNTTTWGETEDSELEPFPIDLDGLLRPGVGFFDLNNRIGALQHQALAAGCRVVSGSVMQRVTNACRAALLHRSV
jgi:shikimate dehydrogenase